MLCRVWSLSLRTTREDPGVIVLTMYGLDVFDLVVCDPGCLSVLCKRLSYLEDDSEQHIISDADRDTGGRPLTFTTLY